jgi:hypothetical protein
MIIIITILDKVLGECLDDIARLHLLVTWQEDKHEIAALANNRVVADLLIDREGLLARGALSLKVYIEL